MCMYLQDSLMSIGMPTYDSVDETGDPDHPCLESTFQILTAMGFRIDSHTLW